MTHSIHFIYGSMHMVKDHSAKEGDSDAEGSVDNGGGGNDEEEKEKEVFSVVVETDQFRNHGGWGHNLRTERNFLIATNRREKKHSLCICCKITNVCYKITNIFHNNFYNNIISISTFFCHYLHHYHYHHSYCRCCFYGFCCYCYYCSCSYYRYGYYRCCCTLMYDCFAPSRLVGAGRPTRTL